MQTSYGEPLTTAPDPAFGNTLRLVDGTLGLTWQHASATAEFLGDFYGLRATAEGLDYNEVRHSVVYVVNELLENALKFRAPGDIDIRTALENKRFTLVLTNSVSLETAERFAVLLAEITSRDPGELLIERIEANAADEDSTASGLGLRTLMNDYGVRLGWRFEGDGANGTARLRTDAALDLG